MADSLPNWELGPNYMLKKKLGQGSYGSVCQAQDTRTGELVAVKQVNGIFDDVVDAKRMLREISILRTMNHPNIIKIKEIIVPPGNLLFDSVFIIMEFAQSDLKKLFRSPAHLDDDQIAFLAYQILCGMRYMHAAKVLHRDLKPANILINEDCTVKICDFGLSRSYSRLNEDYKNQLDSIAEEEEEPVKISDHPPEERKTQVRRLPMNRLNRNEQAKKAKRQLTGHVVTRWYRAPEVILLEKEYSQALDVWSIGCVFAEILNMKRENASTYLDRGPLFPGKSCFPLSPDVSTSLRKGGYPSAENDQINMIFDVIGTIEDDEMEFISDAKALAYIKAFPKRTPKDLQIFYPASPPDAVNLLGRLLTFNPSNRINLDDSISHPYFAAMRDPARETVAEPHEFEWDEDPDITILKLREHFIAEI